MNVKTLALASCASALVHLGLAPPSATADLPAISGLNLAENAPWSLTTKFSAKGLVVVFLSDKCPCSGSHQKLLSEMAEEYKDFQFVGLHSNVDEPVETAKEHFQAAHFPFPVVQDTDARWANHFGALKTPHVFVLSPKGETLYAGGITSSAMAPTAKENYLKIALNEIRTSGSANIKTRRTLGCAIRRSK